MSEETATFELRGDGNQLVLEVVAIRSQNAVIVRQINPAAGFQIDLFKALIDEAQTWLATP